ncbi:Maf family protein [Sphingomicrobium sp. XHP0235]|uniref:Maf family protein n=1 Tax=Sphingomicrobium aquimarinum TaxID=3133971 RepID=UPI0031FF1DF0
MLILGSSSPIRATMLEAAGVAFEARSPTYEEGPVKAGHLGDAPSLALALAKGKALAVPARAGDTVIGGDSVLEVDGRRFDKPEDRVQAAEHLRFFSGKTMELTSAVVLTAERGIVWTHAETARLTVRALDDAFISAYLDAEWPEVGYCVGVFRMEGRGVSLFEKVEGSHFTILGMPLLPLLGALRERGLAP